MTKKSGVTGKTTNQIAAKVCAKLRQDKRDARTTEEQLALLNSRPGKSLRERARLAG